MVTFLSTIAVLQLKFYSFVSFMCVVSDYLSINILLHIIMHYVMLKSTCTLLYAVSAI